MPSSAYQGLQLAILFLQIFKTSFELVQKKKKTRKSFYKLVGMEWLVVIFDMLMEKMF